LSPLYQEGWRDSAGVCQAIARMLNAPLPNLSPCAWLLCTGQTVKRGAAELKRYTYEGSR